MGPLGPGQRPPAPGGHRRRSTRPMHSPAGLGPSKMYGLDVVIPECALKSFKWSNCGFCGTWKLGRVTGLVTKCFGLIRYFSTCTNMSANGGAPDCWTVAQAFMSDTRARCELSHSLHTLRLRCSLPLYLPARAGTTVKWRGPHLPPTGCRLLERHHRDPRGRDPSG